MYKKIFIQLLLLIILFTIVFSTFFLYFNKKENLKISNLPIVEEKDSLIDDKTGTLIKDISYSFSDSAGNYYELLSDVGKIDINNSDKIFMTNVVATIYLVDSSPVTITSKLISSKICLFPKDNEIFLRETKGFCFLKDLILNFFIRAIIIFYLLF